jgi:hypothetical protein
MHSPPAAPLLTQAQDGAKTNGTSVFAFVASLSGYVCFLGVGGALGVVLGLIARSEISRAEGRESGRGLATAAIALGLLNVCLTVIGIAVGITYLARPKSASASSSPPALTAPVWSSPGAAPRAEKRGAKPAARPAPAARASREAGSQVTNLGDITLADVSGDLEAELVKQRTLAAAASETLVLWLVVPQCKPCDGVAAALTSKQAQKALANVRLVRVDRDEFQMELDRLGIPTEKIPGFALLDTRSHARDFIHGGEWDADIAANIAPVLGKFAHGGYTKRRFPWRGPPRDDETQL